MATPVARSRVIALAVAALLLPGAAAGQLPGADPARTAAAGSDAALARGYAAVALNPAGLGLPDNPAFTISLAPAQARLGMGPVGLADVADYGGRLIPRSVKLDWLQSIGDAGGLQADTGAEVSALAFSFRRFGFQTSTVANVRGTLNPDAAELILFGNAGRTGSAEDFALAGSRVDGFAATTIAASYAAPLDVGLGPSGSVLAVGAAIKYTVGHALVVGRDAGSRLTGDPTRVDVEFPVLAPRSGSLSGNAGTGVGLDLGAAWQDQAWTLGVAVQNLVQTFRWNLRDETYRPGQAFFDADTSYSDSDERPAAEAPRALLDAVDKLGFNPRILLAAARRVRPDLVLNAEFRHQFGDGLRLEEKTHFGAAAEYRPADFLPLRAGAAVVDGGFQFGGGAGITVAGFTLSGGVLTQTGDDRLTVIAAGLSFGR